MIPNTELQKEAAFRLAVFYPGVFLGLVVIMGALAGVYASRLSFHDLDNAVRGMTALTGFAVGLGTLGCLRLKKMTVDGAEGNT